MLHVYRDSACTDQISDAVLSSGQVKTYGNPDRTTAANTAQVDEVLPLYIKNDDASRTYSSVVLSCDGGNEIVGFVYALDVEGAPGEWQPSLALPDFTDAVTVVKVWRKLTIVPGLPSQRRRSVSHIIDFVESMAA